MQYELNEREQAMVALISERGSLSVVDLSEKFGISTVTVRSDLKSLEARGLLTRTRGGAVPALHRGILERQSERMEEKIRIAKAAVELVKDGDVIMIEAGTTTALIARYLTGMRDVHIVTNSTLAFGYARMNPALQVTMTGGEFRRPTESLVGPLALETIARLNVRWAFVGTDGFSLARGMTTHLVEGAEIVRAMKAHADTTVLVADASKYGRVGFAHVLPLSAVDRIVTDSSLDAQALRELNDADLDVKTV